MTWHEFQSLLESEDEKLSWGEVETLTMADADLLRLHERTKVELDGVIRRFSQSREWPEMDPQVKLMLRYRVKFALDLVSAISVQGHVPGHLPSEGPDSDLIQALLVQAWDDSTRQS